MEEERVDILLATYNGEKYLKELIQSILNQSYKNFRLIICDDCSTDKTLAIVSAFSKIDKRIVAFKTKSNVGVAGNFETLLKRVESPYFMFADQDDVWKKDKILNSMNKIKEGYDLVYTDLEVSDESANVKYESYWKLKGFYNKIKKYNNFKSLYLNNYITGCTIMCKSEWIEKALPIPKGADHVLHDYWLALMVAQEGKLGYIEEPQIMYRQHKDNNVGTKKVSSEMETLDEIRDHFINVKIEHFQTFVDNNDKFIDDKTKELNQKALDYYRHLTYSKHFCFQRWGLFFSLYKYEDFKYMMENFLILNMPTIARIAFKIMKAKEAREANKAKG